MFQDPTFRDGFPEVLTPPELQVLADAREIVLQDIELDERSFGDEVGRGLIRKRRGIEEQGRVITPHVDLIVTGPTTYRHLEVRRGGKDVDLVVPATGIDLQLFDPLEERQPARPPTNFSVITKVSAMAVPLMTTVSVPEPPEIFTGAFCRYT